MSSTFTSDDIEVMNTFILYTKNTFKYLGVDIFVLLLWMQDIHLYKELSNSIIAFLLFTQVKHQNTSR